MTIDSLSIEMGKKGLFYYPLYSVSKIDGQWIYFGWNEVHRTLDVVNLAELKYLRSISFQYEGPDGVGDVKGLNVINYDSIFFLSSQQLALVNSASHIVEKWGVNDKNEFSGFDNIKNVITTEESFNILYDRKRKKLFTKLHHPNYKWCDPNLAYYFESYVAELDLVKKEFRSLEIPYPSIYQEAHFGLRDVPSGMMGKNGELNFTFSISSNIYQYSTTEEKLTVLGGTSDFTDNMAKSLPIGDCSETPKSMKHNLLNVKYLHLMFDPYRKLYYRFHWGEVPENRADGRFSAYNDKPLYLSVFDFNMAKIGESEVDRKQGPVWSFVTEEGLYVIKARGKEDILGFNLYKFS